MFMKVLTSELIMVSKSWMARGRISTCGCTDAGAVEFESDNRSAETPGDCVLGMPFVNALESLMVGTISSNLEVAASNLSTVS